jgi:hypothetical protein
VTVEKIGMLAQIGNDLPGADLGGPQRRGQAAAERLRLVLRTIGHVYFRGAEPQRRLAGSSVTEQDAIIRKPP